MSEAKPKTPLIRSSSYPKLPDFKQTVKLKYVKLGYHYLITHGMYLILSPLLVVIAAQLSAFSIQDIHELWNHLRFNLVSVLVWSTFLVFLSTLYILTRPRPVYMVNFACCKPENARMCTRQAFMNSTQAAGTYTEENLEFQRKIIERSGIGETSYLPEPLFLPLP